MSGNNPLGRRVEDGVLRRAAFEMDFDGRPLTAHPGETVAAALSAAGVRVFNTTPQGEPRGMCCGIGVCFSCLMIIDGVPDSRACRTPARPGMEIRTQHGRSLPQGWPDGEREEENGPA